MGFRLIRLAQTKTRQIANIADKYSSASLAEDLEEEFKRQTARYPETRTHFLIERVRFRATAPQPSKTYCFVGSYFIYSSSKVGSVWEVPFR